MTSWTLKVVILAPVLVVLITFLLFIFRMFPLGFFGIGILCVLFPVFSRVSAGQGVLFVLKQGGGCTEYKDRRFISKKAICRLEKKGVVKVENDIVRLLDSDYPCIFDEDREQAK